LERSAPSRVSMPESATFIIIIPYFVVLQLNLKLRKTLKSNGVVKI
jgi:hypothetical protein